MRVNTFRVKYTYVILQVVGYLDAWGLYEQIREPPDATEKVSCLYKIINVRYVKN